MDIRPSTTNLIAIGRTGENERLRVLFDVRDLTAEFPGCHFTLLHQRPGATVAYPVPTVEVAGDDVIWTVTAADTSRAGRGHCELICTLGDVVAKTLIYTTAIQTSLDGSGPVPSM